MDWISRRSLLLLATGLLLSPDKPKRIKNVVSVRMREGWDGPKYKIAGHVDVTYVVHDLDTQLPWYEIWKPKPEVVTYYVLCDWQLPYETYMKVDYQHRDNPSWMRAMIEACYQHMKRCSVVPYYSLDQVHRWLAEETQ